MGQKALFLAQLRLCPGANVCWVPNGDAQDQQPVARAKACRRATHQGLARHMPGGGPSLWLKTRVCPILSRDDVKVVKKSHKAVGGMEGRGRVAQSTVLPQRERSGSQWVALLATLALGHVPATPICVPPAIRRHAAMEQAHEREQLGRTRVQLAQKGRPGHAIIRAAPIQEHQHGVWLQLQRSTHVGRQRIGASLSTPPLCYGFRVLRGCSPGMVDLQVRCVQQGRPVATLKSACPLARLGGPAAPATCVVSGGKVSTLWILSLSTGMRGVRKRHANLSRP